MDRWLEALATAQARHAPFVMITLTGIRGSAPGELGARAFVDAAGLLGGTIGGGKVEHRAILHGQAMLQALQVGTASRREAVTWNLTRDIEMTCGGEVTLLFEVMGASSMSIGDSSAADHACLPHSCRKYG